MVRQWVVRALQALPVPCCCASLASALYVKACKASPHRDHCSSQANTGSVPTCSPWLSCDLCCLQLEVCAREGQCQQVSLDDQQKLTALVDSTIGASVSICLGMGKLKDVMK